MTNDVEELLKILEGGDIKAIEKLDNPIESFLQAFSIQHGEEDIELRLLYKLFRLWDNKTPMTSSKFMSYVRPKFILAKGYPIRIKINMGASKISKNIDRLFAAKTIDKCKSKKYKQHFEKFLNHFDIKPGNAYIEGDTLFYLYSKWRGSRHSTFNEASLTKLAFLTFDTKIINQMKWFGIDESITKHLSKEDVYNWRESRKNHGKKTEEISISPPIYPEQEESL